MKGKRILITGATSGIGRAIASELAAIGAEVIIVSRNEEKCQRVVDEIKIQTGNQDLRYFQADLSSQTEIRGLAEKINNQLKSLDVLINNAGAFFWQRQESVDGIEMTFALNHLSYFLLTNLLLYKMRESSSPRIINTSSGGHNNQTLELDNLELKRNYFHFRAYGRSKLANLYFTYELARRLEGESITVNAYNPGFVRTKIAKSPGFGKYFMALGNIFAISVEEGARTGTYLASSPKVEGISGKYYYQMQTISSSEISYDPMIAEQLWQISAEMSGLS